MLFRSTRYATARAPFQLRNTASIAPRSCSRGFCGNGFRVTFLTTAWYCVHSFFSAAAFSSASVRTSALRFAYDAYRRFISMYGRIVLGVDGALFEHPLEEAKHKAGVRTDAELNAAALKKLCTQYQAVVKKVTKKPFPQKPREQLRGAVEAVFASWNGARAIAYRVRERISHDLGTAVNVQAMVFGNREDRKSTRLNSSH